MGTNHTRGGGRERNAQAECERAEVGPRVDATIRRTSAPGRGTFTGRPAANGFPSI